MAELRATVRTARSSDYLQPGGPWDVPTLDTLLTGSAGRGERIVEGRHRVTGAVVDARVAALAGGLRARGVERGDVVAWQLPNGLDALLLFRACWRLGAVAAPVHHGAGPSDVDAALAQVAPAVVVERADLAALLEGTPVPLSDSGARSADLAVALFTAGTTGRPKAVLHTHRALAYKTRLMIGVHGLHRSDSVLMPAPLAHISGLLHGVLVPGAAGMKAVLMDRWDPDDAVNLIPRETITFMIGPPTFFVGIMSATRFSPAKMGTMRLVSSGGATVTSAFVTAASQALGCRVKRTYGSTEAPSVTTTTGPTTANRARNTDGRATGAVELRVVEPRTERPLPVGSVGELWLRGPEVFVGYADADQSRDAFGRGGWFRTGDLGTIDSSGWLTISGRVKDVIIRGGENISAPEVEAILERHPAVRQAAVVGYPDYVLGERVAAFVVTTAAFDLGACRQWFADQGVTKFKTPERVVSVDALPTLSAGKVDRGMLRRMAVGDV